MINNYLTQITENTTINDTLTWLNKTTQQAMYLEQKNSTKGFILTITIIALIATITIFYLYKKKNDKIEEQTKQQKKIQTEILEAFKKLETNEKIKEINISDLPHELRKDLLNEESIFSKLFFKGEDKTGHKPPFLLLIHSDMTGEIKHNAKEGEYILEKKDMQRTKVRFNLTRDKLIDVKIKGKYYRFWVQYEDEAEAYPLAPKHHSAQFYNIVLALQMTKNLMGAKKGKFPKIFIIAGILLVVGGLGYYAWTKAHQGNTQAVVQTIQVINETINQSAQYVQGNVTI